MPEVPPITHPFTMAPGAQPEDHHFKRLLLSVLQEQHLIICLVPVQFHKKDDNHSFTDAKSEVPRGPMISPSLTTEGW